MSKAKNLADFISIVTKDHKKTDYFSKLTNLNYSEDYVTLEKNRSSLGEFTEKQ